MFVPLWISSLQSEIDPRRVGTIVRDGFGLSTGPPFQVGLLRDLPHWVIRVSTATLDTTARYNGFWYPRDAGPVFVVRRAFESGVNLRSSFHAY